MTDCVCDNAAGEFCEACSLTLPKLFELERQGKAKCARKIVGDQLYMTWEVYPDGYAPCVTAEVSFKA